MAPFHRSLHPTVGLSAPVSQLWEDAERQLHAIHLGLAIPLYQLNQLLSRQPRATPPPLHHFLLLTSQDGSPPFQVHNSSFLLQKLSSNYSPGSPEPASEESASNSRGFGQTAFQTHGLASRASLPLGTAHSLKRQDSSGVSLSHAPWFGFSPGRRPGLLLSFVSRSGTTSKFPAKKNSKTRRKAKREKRPSGEEKGRRA